MNGLLNDDDPRQDTPERRAEYRGHMAVVYTRRAIEGALGR